MATGSERIDSRGPRTAAIMTAAVLGVALVAIPTGLFPALVAFSALVAGLGAVAGISAQPYVWLFDHGIAARLSAPRALQGTAAPRFAQACAAILLTAGLAAWFLGFGMAAATLVAAVWVIALTLAVTGYCIGCQGYAVWQQITSPQAR